MIIDEDPADLQLLKRTLKLQGYDIIIADNGTEDMQKAIDLRPSAIRPKSIWSCRGGAAAPPLHELISVHGMGAALPALSVINLLRNKHLPQIDYYRPISGLITLNHIFQINQHNDKFYYLVWCLSKIKISNRLF
ncbi:MAG TPA: hypothetical protein V6C58_10435 [Allocoleopsis sp.]